MSTFRYNDLWQRLNSLVTVTFKCICFITCERCDCRELDFILLLFLLFVTAFKYYLDTNRFFSGTPVWLNSVRMVVQVPGSNPRT